MPGTWLSKVKTHMKGVSVFFRHACTAVFSKDSAPRRVCGRELYN